MSRAPVPADDSCHVKLDRLTKAFGDVVAVDEFSLDIARGEFVTLLGPSGSGKTTTLNMVAGFLEPTQGEIYIDGEPMAFKPPHKRGVGMVFQNYALFPHMTVFDNIAFPLKIRRVPKSEVVDKVKGALELVRLPGHEDRYPHQLSGGQQQRIALARAVVFNPSVLLMDEPLGALDKKLREYMQLEVKHIQESIGITVIYVTHDQSEALTMSERIVVMDHGVVQQVGVPEDLYERPANRFVADFIGETNLLQASVEAVSQAYATANTSKGVRLRIPAATDLSPGRKVYLALRPERIFFAEEEQSGINSQVGVVEETIYLGEVIRYVVVIGEGERLQLKQPNRLGVRRHRAGDQVRIGWKIDDTRVL
ncbi:MAG: ABC transporter ATP-binding protein [Chloroflexi bacterium]|nr:ABC transporter ATP-binding protein [Chloroflexota bacterium]